MHLLKKCHTSIWIVLFLNALVWMVFYQMFLSTQSMQQMLLPLQVWAKVDTGYHRGVNSRALHLQLLTITSAISQMNITDDDDTLNQELQKVLYDELFKENFTILPGGYHIPTGSKPSSSCARQEVLAILVPYRRRANNLAVFLSYMHRFLQLQRHEYHIFVLEQTAEHHFNRAKLINAGLVELGLLNTPTLTQKVSRCFFQCFAIHDVDKLPQHLELQYSCCNGSTQLVRRISPLKPGITGVYNIKFTNNLFSYYPTYTGGATLLDRETLLLINGLSNVFYGWGGEDDDLHMRMSIANKSYSLPSSHLGTFYVLSHTEDYHVNANSSALLQNDLISRRLKKDGVRQVKYQLLNTTKELLFTRLLLRL